jgi:transcriptional regulator with XRE-family HTH domain
MRTPTDPTDKHVGTRVRMRRLMLGMSQTTLADALGLSFQQVQKYEKGKNRISASRLQQISNVLQVPVPFFFEGLPGLPGASKGKVQAPSPAYVTDFVASSDGLSLIKAFMLIKRRDLRLAIVHLIEETALLDSLEGKRGMVRAKPPHAPPLNTSSA